MRRSPVSIWISMLPIANIQSLVWNAMLAQSECPYFLVYGFVEAVHRWKGRNNIAMAGRATPPPTGFSRGSAAGSSPLLPCGLAECVRCRWRMP